jgi:hypothetical protein
VGSYRLPGLDIVRVQDAGLPGADDTAIVDGQRVKAGSC